jgi:hypothetical protein
MLTYIVERRTQEIGVRLALGADRSHVYRVTLREAALPVGIGLFKRRKSHGLKSLGPEATGGYWPKGAEAHMGWVRTATGR